LYFIAGEKKGRFFSYLFQDHIEKPQHQRKRDRKRKKMSGTIQACILKIWMQK